MRPRKREEDSDEKSGPDGKKARQSSRIKTTKENMAKSWGQQPLPVVFPAKLACRYCKEDVEVRSKGFHWLRVHYRQGAKWEHWTN